MAGDALGLTGLGCAHGEEGGRLAAEGFVIGIEFFEIRCVEEERVAAHAIGRLPTVGEEIALPARFIEGVAEIVGGGIERHAEMDGTDEASRVGIVAGDEKIATADATTGVVCRENQGGAVAGGEKRVIDVGETAIKSGQRLGNTPTVAGFHQTIETARATCGENGFCFEGIDEGGTTVGEGCAQRSAGDEATGLGGEGQTVEPLCAVERKTVEPDDFFGAAHEFGGTLHALQCGGEGIFGRM